MKKIDTHQHLLYPNQFTYSWTKDFPDLQGAFQLDDYEKAASDCGIEGTLFMEVDVDPEQSHAEAAYFSELAASPSNNLLGVIGCARPEETSFPGQLEQMLNPSLKGIRRVLHTQPDELSQTPLFRENLKRLSKHYLSFDLCVSQAQLSIALELVQACPNVSFILDHCGVPSIADHGSTDSESWAQWQSGMKALAKQGNVACKFSGITAYASAEQRNVESLRPYLTEILEGFGTERIVWGSDWPVCNLGSGLVAWSELTDLLLADLSIDEQENILSKNAVTLYGL